MWQRNSTLGLWLCKSLQSPIAHGDLRAAVLVQGNALGDFGLRPVAESISAVRCECTAASSMSSTRVESMRRSVTQCVWSQPSPLSLRAASALVTRSRCNGRARHGGSSWFQMQSLKSLSVARNLLTDSSAPAIVATLTALTALAELSLEANNVRVHLSARHGTGGHGMCHQSVFSVLRSHADRP